jgi:multisubunit Na+/H+ antiporter MnhB subunit
MSRRPTPTPAPAEPRSARRRITIVWSAVMVLLGIAIVVRTLASGGGALALGLIVGVLFVLAGAGRLWVSYKGYV